MILCKPEEANWNLTPLLISLELIALLAAGNQDVTSTHYLQRKDCCSISCHMDDNLSPCLKIAYCEVPNAAAYLFPSRQLI